MRNSMRIKEQVIRKPPRTVEEECDEPPHPGLDLRPALPFLSPRVHTNSSPCIIQFPSSRTRPFSPAVRAFKKRFYPAVPSKLWNDWRWQVGHRIRSVAQLERMLVLSEDERSAMTLSSGSLPLAITPYYMSLLSADDPHQALRRTVVPTLQETIRGFGEVFIQAGHGLRAPLTISGGPLRYAMCCCRAGIHC